MRRFIGSLASLVLVACSTTPAERGASGTRLFIDTDLPTPEIANRLRIDLYREDGSWFASREIVTDQPSAFPTSFDLAAPESGQSTIRVRLRIYPDTYTREYLGERFADWPAVLGEAPEETDGEPRLIESEEDRTPGREPLPAVAVDRLVTLSATAGEWHEAGVILHGACAGSMADLATGESCVVAREDGRQALAAPTDALSETSHESDLRESCDGIDVPAGRICVPGGVYVLGERNQTDYDLASFLDARIERLVRVRRFVIDETEIDVARYRPREKELRKVARYGPKTNDGPLSSEPEESSACTYTSKPGDREQLPLNCNSWATYRAFCQAEGGDLPTEVQWEYVAAAAGATVERRFPWGDDEPSCDRAVYARIGSVEQRYCPQRPGIVALDDAGQQGDVTPLGVRGLAGSLTEFVLDLPVEYSDPSWTNQGFEAPSLPHTIGPMDEQDHDDLFVGRGGSWAAPAAGLRSSLRPKVFAASPRYGARCAYPSP